MKKCLKCGIEYQDDDIFCPVCGERLAATNVCQRCGKPVSVEETYCRHCGYKIEKEIKCEQCGAILDAESKFCRECGAKVENPVMVVKERKAGARTAAAPKAAGSGVANPIVNKIFYFVFGGMLVFLLSLMLVGCFGDIAVANAIGRASVTAGASKSQGISYFFGDAIKIIDEASKLPDPSYMIYLIIQFVFEVILWIAAIALFIFGIVYGAIQLTKAKKNEFRLNTKPFVYALLGGLPYLFIFALRTRMFARYTEITSSYSSSYATTTTSYAVETIFGWGTQMILVCTILGVLTLAAYNILTAIFERKDIVKYSVRGGVVVALTIALLASIGFVIAYNYKDTYMTTNGDFSPVLLFESALSSYSSASEAKLPDYAVLSLLSYIFMIFGYVFVQAVINNIINEKKTMAPIIVNVAFALLLIILGVSFGITGCKQSNESTASSSSSSAKYSFGPTAGVIVIILFLSIALAGYIVSVCVNRKQPEAEEAKQ